MEKEISIKDALRIWADQGPGKEKHLSEARLFSFSLPNGLNTAKESDLDHLSMCPDCLDTWKAFCDMNDAPAADDYTSADDIALIGTGELKAAASDKMDFSQPKEYKSSCGKFILSIFPEPDTPTHATITLDTTDKESIFDHKTATVRDANGTVIFRQPLRHGRAADMTESLDTLDLSFWTVFLSESPLKG